MENKLKIAKNILKKYNQEHLLYFYDELSQEQKNHLLNQILNINFEKILTIYNNSLNFHYDPNVKISPISHIEKNKLSIDNINYYSKSHDEEFESYKYYILQSKKYVESFIAFMN